MIDYDALVEEIRSRGFWRFLIRPAEYTERVISRSDLEQILVRCSVSLRGWDFPHISRHEPIKRGTDSIAQGTRWEHYREFWKLFRSGQFLYLGGFAEDWRDESALWPGSYDPQNRRLGFVETIYRLTEVFEFAARLAVTDAGAPALRIEVELHGLDNRHFFMDNDRFTRFHERPAMTEPVWSGAWAGQRDELVGERARLAVPLLVDLFDLYGLTIQAETVDFHQQQLLERRS